MQPMISSTSLTTPSLLAKIHFAMEYAVAFSRVWASGVGQSYVPNRRGYNCIRVDHRRAEPQAFQFWVGNRNITKLVLTALRREGVNSGLIAGVTLGLAMKSYPNFKVSDQDAELIDKIVNRHIEDHHSGYSKLDLTMSLTACHNSNPLRLRELLEAHRFDFSHDVEGIHRNISRSTGEMMNHFSPRFSQ